MNITFITPEYITETSFDGGLSNYIHKIASALSKRGHNIYVIVLSYENSIFNHHGITVIRVNTKSSLLNILIKILRGRLLKPISWCIQSWKLNQALKKLNKKTKIDIAQFTSYTATGLFKPRNIKDVSRISSYQPLLDEVRGYKKNLSLSLEYFLETYALKKSTSIFGPSKLIANIIEKKIDRRIKIIESPLALVFEENIQVYDDILKDKKYLLFFGSLSLLKGVKEIADTLPYLLDKYKDLYFVFVGKNFLYNGTPIINYVWESAGKYRGRVIYLGSMQHQYLTPIIKNAYAVVLPSRIDNFPNTCIESMALKKIVVGTNGASFEQLIDDKKNGFLCDINNSNSLSKTIEKVLSLNHDEYIKIGLNAQKRVKKLEPNQIAIQMEQFYKGVIDE